MPTLHKHYLQLNGVILGFGVDTSFSDALDGFILVDLDEVNPTLLKKYEGEDWRKMISTPTNCILLGISIPRWSEHLPRFVIWRNSRDPDPKLFKRLKTLN